MRPALPILLAAALAAPACSSTPELTGAAAAYSRGAAPTAVPPPAAPLESADPLRDDARVLARVNGKVIVLRQIRHLAGPSYEYFLDQPEQLEKYLDSKAKELVLKQLVLDEGQKLGIRASAEEMKRDLEREEAEAAKRGTTLEQMLSDQGITRREWDQMRFERITFDSARYYFAGFFPEGWYDVEHFRPSVDPTVDPGEVLRYGREHRASVMEIPESASIRILDLRKDSFGGPDERESVRWRLCGEALDAALARVEAGEEFAAVARELSQGPEAANGGLVEGLQRDSMYRKEFLDWTFDPETKEGAISPRFRVPTGFVVLRLEKRQEARTRPAEEWVLAVRNQLERNRQEMVRHEVLIRLLEDASVSPPEFRESLLRQLQEGARRHREAMR